VSKLPSGAEWGQFSLQPKVKSAKFFVKNPKTSSAKYMIEVGAQGHILKSVKDRLWSLFQAWVPAGHRSGIGQFMKDVSRISLLCSFSIFQARNDPVWSSPRLVTRRIDGVPTDV
jgi:hypothetical protein